LSAGRSVPSEAFDHVTIFFSDIEGFTSISASAQPIEIVSLLNMLYTVMDYCASLFPIYKVETIGDSYMVVGGLPERAEDHTEAVADFALLVRRILHSVQGMPDIRLRMGINSGPVVAGVVGHLMPRYCLFGDAVNTASRMESTGEAGRIQCSSGVATKLRSSGRYSMEARGPVQIKGKGYMNTEWLVAANESNPCSSTCFVGRALSGAQALADIVQSQPSYTMLVQQPSVAPQMFAERGDISEK